MASTKVKGIVIGAKDYKEKDKLIEIFTLEKGKIIVSMKGVRGEKAKLKSAKEIFCFGEYIVEDAKSFNIVSQVEIIDNFYNLAQDLDKFYEASAVVDIIKKIAEEKNPQLFIEIIKALKGICYDNLTRFYVIDKFLINIFKGMGYSFLTKTCSSCSAGLGEITYFNFQVGEIVCPTCKNSFCKRISPSCFAGLNILNNTDYDKLSTVKLATGSEIEIYHLLEKNFEWRTGSRFISAIY